MLRSKDKEVLAQDISQWLSEGYIDRAVYDQLARRYEASRLGLAQALRYLGILGGVFTLMGVLGMLTAVAASAGFAMVLCVALSGGCLAQGLRFASDPADRYPQSARMLLTAGLLLWLGALALLCEVIGGMGRSTQVVVCGMLWLPLAFGLAYKYGNGFVLTLAVLGVYHWVGSFSRMLGDSTYAFAIQDPRVMAGVAIFGVIGGRLHRQAPWPHAATFATTYESIGLLYLNMSLLILSIDWHNDTLRNFYVALGFVVSLGQVILGARLQQPLYTGFGLTFIAIHLFTRYFETFWDKFDKGLFFLIGGGLLLGAGLLLERMYRSSAVMEPASAGAESAAAGSEPAALGEVAASAAAAIGAAEASSDSTAAGGDYVG